MLGNNQLGHTCCVHAVFIDGYAVILETVDKDDEVDILLNVDGFQVVQVAQLRAFLAIVGEGSVVAEHVEDDNRKIELFGDGLERTQDGGEVLLAVLSVVVETNKGHKLQIVDYDQLDIVLGL